MLAGFLCRDNLRKAPSFLIDDWKSHGFLPKCWVTTQFSKSVQICSSYPCLTNHVFSYIVLKQRYDDVFFLILPIILYLDECQCHIFFPFFPPTNPRKRVIGNPHFLPLNPMNLSDLSISMSNPQGFWGSFHGFSCFFHSFPIALSFFRVPFGWGTVVAPPPSWAAAPGARWGSDLGCDLGCGRWTPNSWRRWEEFLVDGNIVWIVRIVNGYFTITRLMVFHIIFI